MWFDSPGGADAAAAGVRVARGRRRKWYDIDLLPLDVVGHAPRVTPAALQVQTSSTFCAVDGTRNLFLASGFGSNDRLDANNVISFEP